MTDIFSKEKRSEIMSKIGPKDSKPEIIVRKIVHSLSYRFRLHRKDLPGNPDLVFPKYKKAIFVHGCFWHGHKRCQQGKLPATNTTFWEEKISGNVKRDKSNFNKLRRLGWKYLVIWQCDIKKSNKENLKRKINNIFK